MQADPAQPLANADAFAERVVERVRAKGKVEPGEHRAFGYDPPRHLTADIRLGLRALKYFAKQ